MEKQKKIILRLSNTNSNLIGEVSDKVLAEISIKLSFIKQGACFTPAYQNGWWDGREYLFKKRKFPTGLIRLVIKVLKDNKQDYEIEDVRIKPISKISYGKFLYTLRPYQKDAVEKCIKSQRGIIKVGTGGGKTVIAMGLINALSLRTLFIVNTLEALVDTKNTFLKAFENETPGIIGYGKKQVGDKLTIATMKSVVNILNKTPNLLLEKQFGLIIVDEVHHSGSKSWFKALEKIDTYYRIGLTGTNFRTDGGGLYLQAVSGKKIVDIPTRWLIDKGFLVEPEIHFVAVKMKDNINYPMNYQDIYKIGIIFNEERNKKIIELIKSYPDKIKLVVFERIEHGDILSKMLSDEKIKHTLISGKTKDRDKLKKEFTDGNIKTVLASRIYNESADIPVLEMVINSAGGKSGIQVLQRIGRSLRIHKSKTTALIFDFLDTFNYKLEQHSNKRLTWLEKEKFKVTLEE